MTIRLKDAVSILPGVGPATVEKLKQLKIETVEQLIFTFPSRHHDYTLRDLNEVQHNEIITVEGTIESQPTVFFSGRGKSRLQIHLRVKEHLIKVVFFNQHYLKDRFSPGDLITVSGKWDKGRQSITANKWFAGPQDDNQHFEPVYRLKGLFHQKTFRNFVQQALEEVEGQLSEPLASQLLQQHQLLDIHRAVHAIHFPKEPDERKKAEYRFAYEELFFFQLKMMAMKKKRKQANTGRVIAYDIERLKTFIQSLPFEMTRAQKKVVNEICADLKSTVRMNRLLQGDVGSGKTVVAATAIYAAFTAGKQSAFMAPTEILAEQHAATLAEWLAPFNVRLAFLSGSTKAKDRKQIITALESGEIDVLIGTHALIQPDVVFQSLGLVITDEQHRFGVEQRRILKDKGDQPDVLFMTATPIPRTLAVTTFGEMDVSIIDELPAGRQEIETYWMKEDALPALLRRMEKELSEGRQAYVICPLIEESDTLEVQNAIDVYNQLTQYYGERQTVGLMHGKLHHEIKDEVMREFSEGKIDVLVSTTVVEVGVNVPNATFMLIYDATRFGLAQLHQLRGRIGRGSHQSYCILLADPKNDEGRERMQSMVNTTDGFILAEKDLELRGSGDLFGTKQSGIPDFQFADPIKQLSLVMQAQRDAERLLNDEQFMASQEGLKLREYLKKHAVLEGERID